MVPFSSFNPTNKIFSMTICRHKDNKKESLSNGVTVPALARQEFLRLKRSESRKARSIR